MADEQNTTRAGAPSRLARVPEGRVLAGVCTGLGRYTGIDPVVFRVGFGILVLAQGQGVVLYVAAALFMPAGPDADAVAEKLFRRRFDAPAVLTILGVLLCAVVALGVVGTGLVGLLTGQASTDALAALTVVGLILLVAHARGVDLLATARSLPERLQGYPPESRPEQVPDGTATRVSFEKTATTGGGLPPGAVDLATLGGRQALSGATAAAPETRAPETRADGTLAVKRGRSALTSTTLLVALMAVAALWPVAQSRPGPEAMMILLAVALAVVGGGLLAGGWFRARGLATMGTVLTCALLTTSVAAEAPPEARYGEIEWRPTDTAQVQPDYKIAAGNGRLDLTRLPLKPGQRVTVNAQITLGELDVTLPPGARVEVDARVALGDLSVAGRTISGPRAHTREVLEPEATGAKNPPVIALRIRGRVSDVEVSHG